MTTLSPAEQPRFRQPERAGGYSPIEDYALIGDGHTSALVALDGSVDFACFPRMDSPTVFARVLDAERGGCWQIAPVARFEAARHYLKDTNILASRVRTTEGEVEILDYMPVQGAGAPSLGVSSIVRTARGLGGKVEVALRLDPRFDYGRARGACCVQQQQGIRWTHADAALTLYTELRVEVSEGVAQVRFTLEEGKELSFVLTFRQPASPIWRSGVVESAPRLLEDTVRYWREWTGRCRYEGPYQEAVRRSALVLKLLDYAPTGAMVAAPTTSLPEKIGGVRNWDYRYSWLRDAAFTLYAFYLLGYGDEGESFLDWVIASARKEPASMQILYGIGGERNIEEFELPHLEGYRGSRPVRVGNAAYNQLQLDIYGEVLDSAFLMFKHGGGIAPQLWEFLRGVVEHMLKIWRQPDQGIWEVRSAARHFVYSKALCWVAVDRGIKLAERAGLEADLERWRAARAEIMEELLRRGYNPQVGAFTQSYETTELDASALALVLRKVIRADDPRMRSTVDRVVQQLSEDGLLHRYRHTAEDGLPPGEGVFLMCTFWLVDVYAAMGRVREARALFERLLGYANDVGLYAEEFEPAHGHHLGNFPQAFTHVSLINAAFNLAWAEREVKQDG